MRKITATLILSLLGLIAFVSIALIISIVTLYMLHGFGLVLGHGHMVTPRMLAWPNIGN